MHSFSTWAYELIPSKFHLHLRLNSGVIGVLMFKTSASIDEIMAERLRVSVFLHHPVIWIPESRTGKQQLQLDLGSIHISNLFESVRIKSDKLRLMEKYNITFD